MYSSDLTDAQWVHDVDYYDFGEESFSIPGIGAVLVSGPLASWISCWQNTNLLAFGLMAATVCPHSTDHLVPQVFRNDGTPYREHEFHLIRELTGRGTWPRSR